MMRFISLRSVRRCDRRNRIRSDSTAREGWLHLLVQCYHGKQCRRSVLPVVAVELIAMEVTRSTDSNRVSFDVPQRRLLAAMLASLR